MSAQRIKSTVFADPQADIILQSSDHTPTQYHLRKIYLQAASSVFDDMFVVGSHSDGPELQVVRLEEKAAELDLFLPFVVRGIEHPSVDFDSLQTLFKLGDKYGADNALQICALLLRPYAATKPALVFALAAVYGRYDIVIESLQHFGDQTRTVTVRAGYASSTGEYVPPIETVNGSSEGCTMLQEVPDELRRRIPLQIMWKYIDLHERIFVRRQGTWQTLPSQVSWRDELYGISPAALKAQKP